jgi:hypothetical protein
LRNPHVHVDSNRRVIGTSAGAGELYHARLRGRPSSPLTIPETLRVMWPEHLANFALNEPLQRMQAHYPLSQLQVSVEGPWQKSSSPTHVLMHV